MKYRIALTVACIRIAAESDEPISWSEPCRPFASELDQTDVEFFFEQKEHISMPAGTLLAQTDDRCLLNRDGILILVKYRDFFSREILWYSEQTEGTPLRCHVVRLKGAMHSSQIDPMVYVELSDFMMHFQTVILHSSFIRWNGGGIAFSAPSGTGKSTQAGLWKTYYGADILNGDRTILRKIGDCFLGFGSPYAGSSGIYRNDSAPVRAVVVLRQAKENRIRRLGIKEAYLCLLSQLSVSSVSRRSVEQESDWLTDFLGRVPVFLLECLPDRGAVDLLHDELRGFINE